MIAETDLSITGRQAQFGQGIMQERGECSTTSPSASRPACFGLQRVFSDDRSLDETVAFGDRDCVLVPRGYHTVSAPPGYELCYLNVMGGPVRLWAVANDPNHAWTVRGT